MRYYSAANITQIMAAYDRKIIKMKIAKMIKILRSEENKHLHEKLDCKIQAFIDRLVKSYKYHSVYWNDKQHNWRKHV